MEWTELVALLANVAVVATVLFLVQQNRTARDQAAEASVQIALDGLQDLQMVFVERPHLWPYFREGVAEVPEELRHEVLATAELYLTTVENLLALPNAFVREHWEVWRANVTRDMRRAPVLAQLALAEPGLYNPKLVEMARSGAEGLDAPIAPPPRTRPLARRTRT